MKQIGGSFGKNLNFNKYGFTLVRKGKLFKYVEVYKKRSLKQIGVIIEIWRNEASVSISIYHDDKKEIVCNGYIVDKQSQLDFLLRNNLNVWSHINKANTWCVSQPDASIFVPVLSSSHGRILPSGETEIMINWDADGNETYRHPDYDTWIKNQDTRRKKQAKINKQELKKWLATPFEFEISDR